MLSKLLTFVTGREPVMVGTLATALLGLVVAFGVDISEEQMAAISAVVVAVVGLLARRAVSPVAKLNFEPSEKGMPM